MAIPKAQMTRRRYGAGKLWYLPAGTIDETNFTPTVTTSKFDQGTSGDTVPGFTTALPLGITKEGMTWTRTVTTEVDEAAEHYGALKTVVTGITETLAVALKTVNLTNLRVAMNAASTVVSGTPGASAYAKIKKPKPGEEIRGQLLWESLGDDFLIACWQVFQTNDVSLGARRGVEGMNLDLSFNLELPPPTVSDEESTLYVAGATWIETVSGD